MNINCYDPLRHSQKWAFFSSRGSLLMSRAIFNGVDRYRKSYIAYHTKGQFFSFFMKNKTITDL